MMLHPPERPQALIGAVPLVDTAPNLSHNPWGDNGDAPGLTTSIFLDLLGKAFPPEIPDLRDHWHFNPSIIPKEVVDHLPNIHLVTGRYDILYKAQGEWVDRLEGYGKHVNHVKVNGLHKVKDLDGATEAGREARKHLFDAVKMYVKAMGSSLL
jgi:acetyl esterase/lipase